MAIGNSVLPFDSADYEWTDAAFSLMRTLQTGRGRGGNWQCVDIQDGDLGSPTDVDSSNKLTDQQETDAQRESALLRRHDQ